MIVEKVWWRLHHPEMRASVSANEPAKVGGVVEIFVECIQAMGPYSSDRWREMLDARRAHGAKIPEFDVARVQRPAHWAQKRAGIATLQPSAGPLFGNINCSTHF